MIGLYQAYGDVNDMMDLANALCHVAREVLDRKLPIREPRLT